MKPKLLFFVAFGLCFSSATYAQSDAKKLAVKYKRVMRSITIAYQESRRKSELELVDSQKGELEEIYGQYRSTLKTTKDLPKEERIEQMPKLIDEMERLNNEIMTNVLLPDQADLLRKKIFAINVKSYKGNVIRAIVEHHGDELNLNEEDLARLKRVDEETAEQIKSAREKYEAELNEIKKSLREKLGSTLPQEHLELIDGLSFRQDSKKEKEPKGVLKKKKKKDLERTD